MTSYVCMATTVIGDVAATGAATTRVYAFPSFAELAISVVSFNVPRAVPVGVVVRLPLPGPFSMVLSPVRVGDVLTSAGIGVAMVVGGTLFSVGTPLAVPGMVTVTYVGTGADTVCFMCLLVFFLPSSPSF